jgi:beta-lactam-binding protein with PASTA domain
MTNVQDRMRSVLPSSNDQPEHRFFKITVSVVLGIILLTFLAGLTTFLLSLEGQAEIVVPDVQEEELVQAIISLQERDLYARVQLRYSSDPALKGKVVEQQPASGTVVRAGKEINLVVSQGAIVDRVGSYVGRTLNDVRAELQTVFATFDPLLRIQDVTYVFDEAEPGIILAQDPPPDTELTGITNLDLVVSRGPDVERMPLPAYVGIDYREAIDLLVRANRPFVFQAAEPEPDQRPGVVIEQEPTAGTEVVAGTTVYLTMTEPTDLEEDEIFGVFERVLPNYPISMEISFEIQDPEGERERIFSMVHPGGEIAVPYVAFPNSILVLSRSGQEVIREVVRRPVEEE